MFIDKLVLEHSHAHLLTSMSAFALQKFSGCDRDHIRHSHTHCFAHLLGALQISDSYNSTAFQMSCVLFYHDFFITAANLSHQNKKRGKYDILLAHTEDRLSSY